MKKKSLKTIALLSFGVFALITSCNQGANKDKAATDNASDTLSTEQYKALAEESFVYGLPLVMNYAIMNEYAIDTASSQYKAPFASGQRHLGTSGS